MNWLHPVFVRLDSWVDRRVSTVGARLMGVPYHLATSLHVSVSDGWVEVDSPAARFVGGATLDAGRPPTPRSREHLLLERPCLYGQLAGERSHAIGITHDAWRYWPIEWRSAPELRHPLLDGAGNPISAQLGIDQDLHLGSAIPLGEVAPSLFSYAPQLM